MEPDFSGWATKANLKCSDGRVIKPNAFAHMDGETVPLVWQHSHNEVTNVLGHAVLTNKPEGVWADVYCNGSAPGLHAKAMVEHGDIKMFSIYANQLVEKSKEVIHGMIREVSLVLSGANPGAKIMNVKIAHSSDPEDDQILEDEAVIFTGLELFHSSTGAPAGDEKVVESSDAEKLVEADTTGEDHQVDVDAEAQKVYDSMSDEQKELLHSMLDEALEVSEEADGVILEHAADQTAQEVFNTLTPTQKNVVYYMLGIVASATAGSTAAHSGIDNTEGDLTHQEGTTMKRNLFENGSTDAAAGEGKTLSHSDLETIQEKAQEIGSFKKAFLAHAESLGYGIDDIDLLFPDAKSVTSQPELIARRTEWVKEVLDGAKHSPFSRIKSLAADLTADEARAKGYVKGSLKKDEVIKLLRRVTTPTTVYKKQKLDRDDIIDITDLDVVAWLKWEMRFMLEEELGRAILVGDGREVDDEDKIDEDKLRPIAWDHEMYAHPVNLASNITPEGLVEAIIRARKNYKGTGTPTLFTSDDVLTDMLLIKNKLGDFVYKTEAELNARLRVSKTVVVEVMEDHPDLLGVIVNMADYTIGADRGGQVTMFEDFDIDYNQEKFLIETRISGALTKPKSALVIKRTSGTTVTPAAPTFDDATDTVTIPATTGVTYYNVTDIDNETVMAPGNVVITGPTDVEARANSGYSFPHNLDNDWTFAPTPA